MSAYLADWQTLASAPDRVAALCDHFAPMTDGESCRAILAQFAEKVVSIDVASPPGLNDEAGTEQALHLVLPQCWDGEVDDGDTLIDVWCFPPIEVPIIAAMPASLARVTRLHRRFMVKSRSYDVPWIWWGLTPDGKLGEAVGADETIQQGGGDRRFVLRLKERGLKLEDIEVPINAVEDWYLLNPLDPGDDGEPRWSYVSGESCEVGPALRRDRSLAAGLLRLLVHNFASHPDARPIK
jgi:hypothetical protein